MERVRSVEPGAFVATMAAGAIGVAAYDRGFETFSRALLWTAVVLFAAVLVLLAARLAGDARGLLADVTRPGVVFQLFALPSALALLSDRLWEAGRPLPALGCWAAGAAAWSTLAYLVPLLLITGRSDEHGATVGPGWVTPVVATQTLVSSATLLSGRWAPTFFLFAGLSTFLLAWGLYLVLVSWIGRRLVFGEVRPELLTAHHWLPVAALATSGFAATRLIAAADRYPLVGSARPVLDAFAVTAWTGCSAWLGLVVALDAWRLRRLGPQAFVAPNAAFATYAVAAYAIASHEVSVTFGLSALGRVADAALWTAVAGGAAAAAFTVLWLAGASVAEQDG